MKAQSKPLPLGTLLAQPRTFVARLILADLITKRGEGPLERRVLMYQRPRKR
ncbi:MAG: hypothetical protein JRG67_05265 [Deltaproteobacteria bacterium]|nr:hypothetical protein [Deltaproteobacteria bacterium]MBW2210446.1 hypothetical protein [Deltaproteobacteria bacterium]MBW2378391.1 hypothetical protein [Deltaproteobacteria bacterium]MBW2626369.1 hypothetical protein [Deltaproteobacteria bacterium]MBW2685708.1 hypothetical protein [Deltaproteobacteria bacterium]